MKYKMGRNIFLKNLILSLVCIGLFNLILSSSDAPKVNIYKTDKSVKHSLFKEKDSIDRMSKSHEGVPEAKRY